MIINGKTMNIKRMNIHDLLKHLDIEKDKVVVEVNQKIILKENYEEHTLDEEDKIEIVSFVGGG